MQQLSSCRACFHKLSHQRFPGLFGKGLVPFMQNSLPLVRVLLSPAFMSLRGLSSPARNLSHLQPSCPPPSPVPKASPSPPGVSSVALGICNVCSQHDLLSLPPWNASLPGLTRLSVFFLYPCHHTLHGSATASRIKPDVLQFDRQSSSQAGTTHLCSPTSTCSSTA